MRVCAGIKIVAMYEMLENYLWKLSAELDWLFKVIQDASMPQGNLKSFICYKKYCIDEAFSLILLFCWLHRMWILFMKRLGETFAITFCM